MPSYLIAENYFIVILMVLFPVFHQKGLLMFYFLRKYALLVNEFFFYLLFAKSFY